MIRSLFLKLGLLVVTMGIVLWIGWTRHVPVPTSDGSPQEGQIIATAHHSSSAGQELRVEPAASASGVQPQGPRLVDLNRADATELEALPGVGAVLAQRVIAFRDSVGRFRRIEELRGVKGIGAKKFERLKSWVTVSMGDRPRHTEHGQS